MISSPLNSTSEWSQIYGPSWIHYNITTNHSSLSLSNSSSSTSSLPSFVSFRPKKWMEPQPPSSETHQPTIDFINNSNISILEKSYSDIWPSNATDFLLDERVVNITLDGAIRNETSFEAEWIVGNNFQSNLTDPTSGFVSPFPNIPISITTTISNFTLINSSLHQNTTYSNETTSGFQFGFHHPALALLLGLFCVFTILGNILVMVAVARERYLHTVTNYFIVSLATADCLVGAVVMPFSVVHEAMNKYWVFGQNWCDVWHSVDVLGSTASILNLCVISLDRYWAITDPISYPSKMTNKRAVILIGVVWVCASLISFPAIAWWRAVSVGLYVPNSCLFTEDLGYLVFSSIISFYGPLTVMVFTYYRIYRAAAEQTRSLRLGTKQVLACNGEEAMELTLRIHRGGTATPSSAFHDSGGSTGGGGKKGYHPVYPTSPGGQSDISETVSLSLDGIGKNNSVRVVPKNLKNFSFSRKLARMAKEQKAAKTLGIVMGVFVLCWMPFFLCNVLLGFCSGRLDCFQDAELVSSVVTWLGWINSGMNPVIYACWSRDFRRAFTKILCVCCPRVVSRSNRHRLRSRICQSISTPMSSSCSTECVRL